MNPCKQQWSVIQGDCREVLAAMPAESVHCVMTSPPYFGLRDYSLPPLLWGGEPECAHVWGDETCVNIDNATTMNLHRNRTGKEDHGQWAQPRGGSVSQGQFCQLCGCWRGSLGLEPTPSLYIEHLVDIFQEVRRVLRDDGVVWLNLGDSFQDLQLQGVPWLVAQALQADGWYLRSAVVWAKGLSFCEEYSGSVMPESVAGWRWEKHKVKVRGARSMQHGQEISIIEAHESDDTEGKTLQFNTQYIPAKYQDCPGCPKCAPDGYVLRRGAWRPSRGHEMLFMLTKTGKYFADQDAVREKCQPESEARYRYGFWGAGTKEMRGAGRPNGAANTSGKKQLNPAGRNLRDVWVINPEAFPGAHFATFPKALVTPCIKASASEAGVCRECGANWARVIKKGKRLRTQTFKDADWKQPKATQGINGQIWFHQVATLGWRPTCQCLEHDWTFIDARTARMEYAEPAIVLDPFCGSGTTGVVALRLGRRFVGIDLSEDYCKMARQRIIDDMPLLNTP